MAQMPIEKYEDVNLEDISFTANTTYINNTTPLYFKYDNKTGLLHFYGYFSVATQIPAKTTMFTLNGFKNASYVIKYLIISNFTNPSDTIVIQFSGNSNYIASADSVVPTGSFMISGCVPVVRTS